jgi:hypothetical protein
MWNKVAPNGYDAAWAWGTFLSAQARKDDKPRFILLIAGRLTQLKDLDFGKLVRPISDWFLRASETLLAKGRDKFELLWERLIANLKANEKAGKSSVTSRQYDWATAALNSPAGYMAQALSKDLPSDVNSGQRLPQQWRIRADQLLSLRGDPRRHALAIFSYNLRYLFYIDPEWTEGSLLSVIAGNKEDADAFWAGFFWRAHVPQESLYLKMKPSLLTLAEQASFARRQHAEILAGILLNGWNRKPSATGQRLITNEEMRTVLIEADDAFRSQVVWQLDRWSEEKDSAWSKDTLTFLHDVWPKQIAAKTSGVSARLAELAFSHDEDFPEYVEAVIPLVIPINEDYVRLPSLQRSEGRNVIEKFPQKTLELLAAILPEDARRWPYGMDEVLGRIGLANPSLLNDPRLLNLNRIWNAR